MLRQKLTEEYGFFYFQTVLLFTVVLALGIAVFDLARVESQISSNQEQATEALYIAEAGIQMAINQLEKNPLWSNGYKNYPFGRGKIYVVEVTQSTNGVRLESQGEVDGLGRRIRVDLAKEALPFKHTLLTKSMQLSPGTELFTKGGIMHSGNINLPAFGHLEGQIEVDGNVTMKDFSFKGSMAAYGSIEIDEKTLIDGSLISRESILSNGLLPERQSLFPFTPMIRPPGLPLVDFNWYRNKGPKILEEATYPVGYFGTGFYMASGDLELTSEGLTETYYGKKAIVSEGCIFIKTNLIPRNYSEDAFLIIAKDIIVDSQVDTFWGGLIAKESITIQGGLLDKNFFGTLQAPSVFFPSGLINLQFYPIPGENLVKSPQTRFKLIDRLEIMVMK